MAATDRKGLPLGLVSPTVLLCGALALLLPLLAGTAAKQQGEHYPAELVAQLGHHGGIDSLAYSPDGGRIVSGGRDNSVRVWDVTNGEVVGTLIGPGRLVASVAYSPDGRHIASAGSDHTVRVWNAESGAVVATFIGHSGNVTAVAYSPDGRHIASAGSNNTVRVWNAESGEEGLTFAEHTGTVTSIAYSPDGKHIASGGWDETIRVWNAESGEKTLTLTGHTDTITSIAYSPESRRIVSGSADNTIRVWNAEDGKETQNLAEHTDTVTSVAYSPDGERIVSGSEDHTVRVWDSETGEPIKILAVHKDTVTAVAYSPDGQYFASGSNDYTLRVWNAEDGTAVSTFRQNRAASISAVGFSSDGAHIAVAATFSRKDNSRRIRTQFLPSSDIEVQTEFWLLDGANATPVSKRTHSTGGQFDRIHFSPDGKQIAAINASEPMSVLKWDIETNITEEFHQFTDVVYSPNGEQLASASADGRIRIIEIANGNEMKSIPAHTGMISSLTYSPNGQRIAFSVADDTIHVWDVEHHKPVLAIPGLGPTDLPEGEVSLRTFAFSPDGKRMATAGIGHPTKVWNAETGEELLATRETIDSPSLSIAYSPDGKHIAVGGFSAVEILDALTAERLSTFSHGFAPFVSLEYSPDGKKLAGGSVWGDLVIWDLETQEALQLAEESLASTFFRFFGFRRGSEANRIAGARLAFNLDSTQIATASGNQVRIWDTKTGAELKSRNVKSRIVTSVDFRSDGKSLAFGSLDWTLGEWNVVTDKITTYPLVEDWVRQLAQESSTCRSSSPALPHTTFACTSSRLVYGTANGTVVLSEIGDEENDNQDEIVFRVLPFGEWITYRPSNLTYWSSRGAESHIKIRFNDVSCEIFKFLGWTHCPLYPLEWYREELRRTPEDLSLGNVGALQTAQPAQARLAVQMVASTLFNNPVAVLACMSTFLLAWVHLYVRWYRNNPLVLARTFFLRTHWNPTWISRRRALRLRTKAGTQGESRNAYVFAGHGGVRGATPNNLRRFATKSTDRPQAYVIYPGSTPRERKRNLEEVRKLKFDLRIDVIPLDLPTLHHGLMSENCDSILSEVEMLYLTLDDPYADAMPIKDPNFFFGRQDRLEAMAAKIADGQHVGIFGLRKTGKTSLAMRLLEQFRNIPIIYVSCQGLDSTSADAVLSQIARSLRERSSQLDSKAAKSLTHRRNGLRSEIEDVLIWWEATGRRGPCVVVLDEIEELYPIGDGVENRFQISEGKRAFSILRSLAQEHRSLSLVVIGYRPDINRMNGLPWEVGENPMFMSVNEFFSGFLSHEESAQMLRELGAWKQIKWEDEALEFVYRECGGHPFITRMFASAATKGAQTINARLVVDTVEQIRDTMRNNPIGAWYSETIDNLPEPELKVLSLITESRTPLSEEDIPKHLADALTNLENYNLVRNETEVEFASELLAFWLNTRVPR